MSNIKLLNEVKLWPRLHGIPTQLEYDVLVHLASDPEARAYLEEGFDYEVGVSNAGGTPGWVRRGAIYNLMAGCHYDRRSWVTLDKEASKKCKKGIKAYKISKAGFEAIAQFNARHRYEKEHLALARRLLEEERVAANALKPK